ncbi:hypothetical protein TRVL_05231 [Trypanosoma vivax]|nr:hypothetical protein TRVL_05231 [Trypanosoma vivax]
MTTFRGADKRVCALFVPLLLLHISGIGITASRCKYVDNSESWQTPVLTQEDYLAVLFRRDTMLASWYCSAVCHKAWGARDERLMRLEMEWWIRANHSVGMFPEAYDHTMKEIMRVRSRQPGDRNQSLAEQTKFASQVNKTLNRMPWLHVSSETVARAFRSYNLHVRRMHIVRAINLEDGFGEYADIVSYQQAVETWWAEESKRVERDPRLPPPLLPWVEPQTFLGSTPFSTNGSGIGAQQPTPPEFAKFPFYPPPVSTPVSVVYHYEEDCEACEVFGAAFELLPLIFRRLCDHGHHFIVSCKPVVLFFSAVPRKSNLLVPRLLLYGVDGWTASLASPFSTLMASLSALFGVDLEVNNVEVTPSAATSTADALLQLLAWLARWKVIQLRYVTPSELTRHVLREEDVGQQESLSGRTGRVDSGTPTGRAERKGSTGNLGGPPTTANRTTTLFEGLHYAVRFHMDEIFGHGSSAADEWRYSTWAQMEPWWLKAFSISFSLIWLAKFVLNRDNAASAF